MCGAIAFGTAVRWWNAGGRAHRWRVIVVGLAVLTVAAGWPISTHVSELRLPRFDPDPGVAAVAKAAFGPWHLVSLGLSLVTIGLAGLGLALAARLPGSESPTGRAMP